MRFGQHAVRKEWQACAVRRGRVVWEQRLLCSQIHALQLQFALGLHAWQYVHDAWLPLAFKHVGL